MVSISGFPFIVRLGCDFVFTFAFGCGYSTSSCSCKCGASALPLLLTWTCWGCLWGYRNFNYVFLYVLQLDISLIRASPCWRKLHVHKRWESEWLNHTLIYCPVPWRDAARYKTKLWWGDEYWDCWNGCIDQSQLSEMTHAECRFPIPQRDAAKYKTKPWWGDEYQDCQNGCINQSLSSEMTHAKCRFREIYTQCASFQMTVTSLNLF